MTPSNGNGSRIGAWRHARAIALLPFMNTVAIPSALLALWPASPWTGDGIAAALQSSGILLAGAGLALVAHCVSLFVRLGHGTLAPWDPARALIHEGAYRYTRNPLKAGLLLVLAGEVLVFQSAALAVWLASFVLVNAVYIRLHEEPGLERRFGASYRDYCARVPRWWPALRALCTGNAKESTP